MPLRCDKMGIGRQENTAVLSKDNGTTASLAAHRRAAHSRRLARAARICVMIRTCRPTLHKAGDADRSTAPPFRVSLGQNLSELDRFGPQEYAFVDLHALPTQIDMLERIWQML